MLVEPSVFGSSPCRIVFRANSLGTVAVGVGIPSVAANRCDWEKYYRGYAGDEEQGTFVGFNGGGCYRHGHTATPSAVKYVVGQLVSVEWDGTHKLKLTNLCTNRYNEFPIPQEYLEEPLHFAVWMSNSDVSLIQ